MFFRWEKYKIVLIPKSRGEVCIGGVTKKFETRRHKAANADTKDTKKMNNRNPFVNLRVFVFNVFFSIF
jgi:hypothetical protein